MGIIPSSENATSGNYFTERRWLTFQFDDVAVNLSDGPLPVVLNIAFWPSESVDAKLPGEPHWRENAWPQTASPQKRPVM